MVLYRPLISNRIPCFAITMLGASEMSEVVVGHLDRDEDACNE
jgi:hypothetical protein